MDQRGSCRERAFEIDNGGKRIDVDHDVGQGILGDMAATGDWRALAEEIWPFVQAPPSTPMGEAEAAWLARRPAVAEIPA